MKNCIVCNSELKGRQLKYCSWNCKNKYNVTKSRRRLKTKAVNFLGGKCMVCEYNKCIAALEFYHLNPDEKDINISKDGITYSWNKIKD